MSPEALNVTLLFCSGKKGLCSSLSILLTFGL